MTDQELIWFQPPRRRDDYELRAGSDVVARLRMGRQLAEATADGKSYTFQRQGFWRQRIIVRTPGSSRPVVLQMNWWGNGGRLEFADGRAVRLAYKFWTPAGTWSDAEPLIRFRSRGFWKRTMTVEIDPGARHLRDLGLLIVLGFFCIRLHIEELASAGAGG